MLEGKKIGLIGAGVMAEVIALGLVRSKLVPAEDIIASHYRPERLSEFREMVPVNVTQSNSEAYQASDLAILCVRPQAMLFSRYGVKPLAVFTGGNIPDRRLFALLIASSKA